MSQPSSASDERLLSSFLESKLQKPRVRLTSGRGNIFTDGTVCLDDPHFLANAIGKTRKVINQVVSMFDGVERIEERIGGFGAPGEKCERYQNEEESSVVVIHGGLLNHQGAIIFEVTGLDCNNVPIATIILNDYYYSCHKTGIGASLIKI